MNITISGILLPSSKKDEKRRRNLSIYTEDESEYIIQGAPLKDYLSQFIEKEVQVTGSINRFSHQKRFDGLWKIWINHCELRRPEEEAC